ncbi:MAG: aminotransferase class I/II-fold pyridoxal phosphate-dependent enzyme [Oscillatoria sp. SIO1A7]|nr:aminotransferase class I/II-fold pyridoxal phosphate-dependent enzyme [Oscillatoria sp. SIO1A7]
MKKYLQDLAIFGNPPAFPEPLHVGRPNIGNREQFLELIDDVLDRKWLTNNGKYVREFEKAIAAITGAKHCIAVSNGTMGLELAAKAAEIKGEAIVPSFTFIATAHALQWLGITPVFADIDPETHAIDPEAVESLITPNTTAIIGVHIWGESCPVEALADVARRHGLTLIFDAAHAFACSHQGQPIGRFGEAEVFSFHATKFINSLEGGAITTDNDELARKIRLMKNFGFAGYDRVVSTGTNGKMNEISAAMGLTSLACLDEWIEINYRHYRQYRQELAGSIGIRLYPFDERERRNYQYIILEIDETASKISRDRLLEVLQAENILARRYFYPGCHKMEPYRSSGQTWHLPQTERLASRVISLPTGTALQSEDISQICQIIRLAASFEF